MAADEILKKLSLREKISLLSGVDGWHTASIPRLGIESIRTSDGPNGVRGTRIMDPVPGAVFPCGTALASTWDVDLIQEVGRALADECYAKGAHVILGPTCNIQRSPLGGRGFESYSEDPLLSGKMAAAWINGVQSKNIGATIKHFVCNDQETKRMSIDAIVDETTLREIYLKPFEIALRDSQPWAFMTAYNRVNGTAASESLHLLDTVLRQEWRFGGRTVMSDWFGTYSIAPPVRAGLSLEMPGPSVVRMGALERAVNAGQVSVEEVERRAGEVVDLYVRTRTSKIPERAPETRNDTPEMRKLLRRVATDAIVLLKNDGPTLPLSPDGGKLAIIGPLARTAVINGGGSASLMPYYAVTPEQGVRAAVSEETEVEYHVGTYAFKMLPLDVFAGNLKIPSGDPGVLIEFFNEPLSTPSPVVYSLTLPTFLLLFLDGIPPVVNSTCYARIRSTFTSPSTATYDFGLSVAGQADLFLDSSLLIDNSTHQTRGDWFFGAATVEERGKVELVEGREYDLEIRFGNDREVPGGEVGLPPLLGRGVVRLGAAEVVDVEQGIEEAVEAAKGAERAVCCVGLSGEWESEGFDRPDMKLPMATDELVSRVLEAQPNTVVVVQSGTPVEMPWLSRARCVIWAGFGGCEAGNAIADVVFGRSLPSGRLSLTWPNRIEDSSAFGNFPGDGTSVHYREGLGVGYRSTTAPPPMFAFGHGLSHPSVKLGLLSAGVKSLLSTSTAFSVVIGCSVKREDVFPRLAREVVAVYVEHPRREKGGREGRPRRELKGFKKVEVSPGETVVVELEIKDVDLGRCVPTAEGGRGGEWVLEKGRYVAVVGRGRPDGDGVKVEFSVGEELRWKGLAPSD